VLIYLQAKKTKKPTASQPPRTETSVSPRKTFKVCVYSVVERGWLISRDCHRKSVPQTMTLFRMSDF